MRPAKKTSPVKLHRGGGPVPRPSKRGTGVTGKRPPPYPKRGDENLHTASIPLRPKRVRPKAAALRERRLRAAALKRKRLKEKKGTPKEPFNPIDKVPGGRPDPLLRAGRKRAADLRRRRRQELSAANKANRSAVRSDNKQAASDLAKFNAARKRQAKKATPTATPTAKPVGDRRVPVSRRVPFRGTGKPPTARRTAKPVRDRRFPVSRRIRQR